MSFKKLISGLVSDAIGIIGDLAEPITFIVRNPPTYLNGVVTSNDDTIELTGVLSRFRADEKDETINVVTDMKVLIAADDLGIDPLITHRLIARDVEWQIINVMTIPGKGLWKLQVRKA